MLKPRVTMLLVVAAILSLLASVIARNLLVKAPREVVVEAPPAPTKVTIMVATRNIDYLGKVSAEAVREHVMIEADLPGSISLYATKPDEVVGLIAMNPIHSGSLIQRDDLRSKEAGLPLALEVREGYRAMTVRVDDVKGVGGFLARGNLVDLIVAHLGEEHQPPTSSVLAQSVRVLAVDQDMTTTNDKPVVVKSVTLEVTPEIAEAIARAQLGGSLQLLLRHPQDSQISLMAVRKTEASTSGRSISFLQGRDNGHLRTYDCDPSKPCPQTVGD